MPRKPLRGRFHRLAVDELLPGEMVDREAARSFDINGVDFGLDGL